MIHPALFVDKVKKKGRGVFTRHDIPKNTLIEIASVIVLPKKERNWLDQSVLYDYYFLWGDDDSRSALCLGYGSLYNHSYQPNLIYEANYELDIIEFTSLRDIKAFEELTINYHCEPDEQKPVWFAMDES